jgi:hypothetical protein
MTTTDKIIADNLQYIRETMQKIMLAQALLESLGVDPKRIDAAFGITSSDDQPETQKEG